MKKTYMRPEGTVIQLCMEQHILDGSITANTSQADAQDNVEFESAAKGLGQRKLERGVKALIRLKLKTRA